MFHREYSKAFHFIYELWSGVLPQHANIILILFSIEIDTVLLFDILIVVVNNNFNKVIIIIPFNSIGNTIEPLFCDRFCGKCGHLCVGTHVAFRSIQRKVLLFLSFHT